MTNDNDDGDDAQQQQRDPFELLAPINRTKPSQPAAFTSPATGHTKTVKLTTERDETTQTQNDVTSSAHMEELIARVRALESIAREGFAAQTSTMKKMMKKVEALTGRLESVERALKTTRTEEDIDNDATDVRVPDDVRRASSYEDIRGGESGREDYGYARDYDARDYDARDYDERSSAPPPPPPPPPRRGHHHHGHPPPPHHRGPPPHGGPPPPHHYGGPPPPRYAPPPYSGPPPPMTPEPQPSYGAPPTSPASVPLEHMIADFASMGFTRQQVVDAVGAMAARGEKIEVNDVLDRLMREFA